MYVQGFGLKIAVPFHSGFQLPAPRADREGIALKSDLWRVTMAQRRTFERYIRPAGLVDGTHCARDALCNVHGSMSAIAEMIRALLGSGEDQSHVAESVYILLAQQRDMLAGIFEELSDEEAERGLRQARTPTEALVEPARKLRLQFIESNAKAGVDHALIGAALNLPGDDIARVIGQLRGEASPRRAPARAVQA